MTFWRHIEFNFREGGFRQLLRKVVWKIRQWLWSDSPWLIYRLDVADYHREPVLSLTCRHLDFDSLRQLGYYRVSTFPEALRARFHAGQVCNGFFLGDQLANVAWTSRSYLLVEHGLIIRHPDCLAIFDCYTQPEYRGRGIYTDTLIRLLRAARDEGAATVLIAVDPVNVPSIRAIERAGFIPYYHVTHARRFGRSIQRRSSFRLKYGHLTEPTEGAGDHG